MRRAALAAVLAPDPDILLLDEPTNHLDLPTIEWMEKELAGSRAAIVLISHNMRDVIEVADSIEVLRLGRRIARLRNDGVSVQDLVGAMTGALDEAAARGEPPGERAAA